jgi:PTS system ascorbate-specific IIA component
MMHMSLLTKAQIQRVDGGNFTWQEAITCSAAPLLEQGVISQDYVDAVLDVCREKGPYMNIGAQVVLAHARPLPSTKEPCMALLQTDKEISLINDEHPARLWFFLATPDDKSHLSVIQQLAGVLMDKEKVARLLAAEDVDELAEVFAG